MNNLPIANKLIDPSLALSMSKQTSEKMKLKEAAEEFESLFIAEMLKRAHAAKLAKGILSSEAEDTYTSLLNQERSRLFAKKHNFGIAEALVRQFGGSNSNSINKENFLFDKKSK